MLDLSRVTLLFVETRAHDITKRVIADCLSKATFGDVLVFTDQPERIGPNGARYIHCVDFTNKREAGSFYYGSAMASVRTDFALMLEWDAGIFDASKWLPEFFDYDYIGAPWTVKPREIGRMDVGNGGFMLMSRRLGHFVAAHPTEYPVTTDWDFCRAQRGSLELKGFKWPNRELASLFSWELGPRNPNHFGFHGAFRWIDMLSREEIITRVEMLTKTPYLLSKLKDVFRYDTLDWLEKELDAETWAKCLAARLPQPRAHVVGQSFPGYMSPQQRAAMNLRETQRRGLITHQQKGLKA